MKRREFILGATGSAGILLLDAAKAAVPCAPILDGAGAPPCVAADAEADWQARIAGPGVVWYHDFRSDAEVDAFRWAGGTENDPGDLGKPNTVFRQTADGITGGGCLEIFRADSVARTSDEPAVWWRPFSPMDTGSGKSVDDPGANRSIPVRAWAPTQGGGQTRNWNGGYYGHPDYHSASPGQFDGHDYWLQARVKIDSRRNIGTTDGGKLFYFTRTDKSLTSQEIVTTSGYYSPSTNESNWFHMYRSGSPPLVNDDPGSSNQPNSELGFCDWPESIANCWSWSGGWDTVLYHVVNGLSGNNDTVVQVWAAHQGETKYVRIWDQDNVDLPFDLVNGHNALICSAYNNGNNLSAFYHRFDQLIFSKDFIPCPQV